MSKEEKQIGWFIFFIPFVSGLSAFSLNIPEERIQFFIHLLQSPHFSITLLFNQN